MPSNALRLTLETVGGSACSLWTQRGGGEATHCAWKTYGARGLLLYGFQCVVACVRSIEAVFLFYFSAALVCIYQVTLFHVRMQLNAFFVHRTVERLLLAQLFSLLKIDIQRVF